MNKLLTVVVPTYNMEKYLQRCLDSLIVAEEQMEQLEVLVINDGSKDRSSEIAHEYEMKFPLTFRVIDKENGNYGSCVNRGLKEATGKYIKVLDADDWFDNQNFNLFIYMLKTVDSDIVLTNFSLQYFPKGVKHIRQSITHYYEFQQIANIDFSSKRCKDVLVMHAMTHKTELLKKIGYCQQTGISYTDIEYCYFPFSKAKSFQCLDIDLYQYFIGREGQTMNHDIMICNIEHFYKVASRIIRDYLNKSDYSYQRKMALVYIMSNPIYQIYLVCLIFLKSPTHLQMEYLNKIEELVSKDFILNNFVSSMTYHKIPFVYLWQNYRIRLGRIVGK